MQLELFMAETLFKKYRRMIVPLQKKKIQFWVCCGTSLIPGTWKPEADRSLNSRSARV